MDSVQFRELIHVLECARVTMCVGMGIIAGLLTAILVLVGRKR